MNVGILLDEEKFLWTEQIYRTHHPPHHHHQLLLKSLGGVEGMRRKLRETVIESTENSQE